MPEQLAVTADVQLRLEVAVIEPLACGRTAQRDHIPVEQPGIRFQVDAGFELGLRGGIDDGFLRQPFQRAAGFDVKVQGLAGGPTGAVPLGSTGTGELHPGIAAGVCADIQAIAAGDPARRMDDDVLAHLRSFGVQVLLHPQRPAVAALHRASAVTEARIAEFKLGVPLWGEG